MSAFASRDEGGLGLCCDQSKTLRARFAKWTQKGTSYFDTSRVWRLGTRDGDLPGLGAPDSAFGASEFSKFGLILEELIQGP